MKRTFIVDVTNAPFPFFEVCQTTSKGTLGDIYDSDQYEVVKSFYPLGKPLVEADDGVDFGAKKILNTLRRARTYAKKISGQKRVIQI